MAPFTLALSLNQTIQTLDLQVCANLWKRAFGVTFFEQNNLIGPTAAKDIAALLEKNPPLTKLNLNVTFKKRLFTCLC